MAEAGFERTELPGGLRVLTERMPAVRSVTLGIWAGVGSRDETPRLAGASHYLEHLLFKGTRRRSARDIAEAMDAVGGETNAFTSKEYTCFYARTLDRDLPVAVDVLVDMLRFSKMTSADVDAERTVILEEIGMHNDAPDDVVHDLFAATLFGGHQLGRPVLGTVDSITAMQRDAIARYWRRHYVPGNLVVAAAGSLEHDQVVELVAEAFGNTQDGEPIGPREGRREPRVHGGVAVRRKPTEQAHVVPGQPRAVPGRPAPLRPRGAQRRLRRRGRLAAVPGGPGEARPGLLDLLLRRPVHATGSFLVYAGAAPKRIHDVLAIVRDELERVVADGLTEAELQRGKGHLEGSLVLGMEDTAGRMTRLGKSELTFGEILSVDEVIRRVDAVTDGDVRAVAKEVLGTGPRALALIGPFDDDGFSQYVT